MNERHRHVELTHLDASSAGYKTPHHLPLRTKIKEKNSVVAEPGGRGRASAKREREGVWKSRRLFQGFCEQAGDGPSQRFSNQEQRIRLDEDGPSPGWSQKPSPPRRCPQAPALDKTPAKSSSPSSRGHDCDQSRRLPFRAASLNDRRLLRFVSHVHVTLSCRMNVPRVRVADMCRMFVSHERSVDGQRRAR